MENKDGDSYLIKTAADLATISALTDATNLTFKLTENLAAPDNFNLHNGTLDGDNHLLTNINAAINGTVSNLYYHGATLAKSGNNVTNGEKYQRTTTAGAVVATDKISYAAKVVDDFTSKVEVSGSKVKITKDALQGETITLNNADGQSYELELTNEVEQLSNGKPTQTAAAQIKNGNTATHYASSGGEKFTLTGIKSADGVTVDNYKVTVATDALDMTATRLL